MNCIPKNSLLEFNLDTLFSVRKMYGLEGEGRMDAAIDILQDWVQKQPHFNKKDFSRAFLEVMLIMCKGQVERTKRRLDKYCTYRTLMPKFYQLFDPDNDVNDFLSIFRMALIPKLTKDHCRLIIVKLLNDPKLSSATFLDYFRYISMMCEWMIAHDYLAGFVAVLDYSDVSLTDLISSFNVIDLSQYGTIFMEAYGMRIREIHVITRSKTVDALLTLFKKVFSPKLSGRFQVHKTIDAVYDSIPKDLFPKDYGGNEKSHQELADDMLMELTSENHLRYMKTLQEARTNEQFRPTDVLNNEYMGTPGTFRSMRVD